uniref:Uncharacterized protein n=1 Tax=Streptoalloteichus tenebrarius (strain ATCC 17920 / DSM 40477 / JCM 4838 / CBS 697.72 / NBRC 16177 / NCIMB 11028 / NRRL B-12390 / A12253. 1 / ISP 5477) TaxID=1933 RepID=Q70IX6_STRSD|nr:hypothetical protein [Streptoalloteichus tenebrarius]
MITIHAVDTKIRPLKESSHFPHRAAGTRREEAHAFLSLLPGGASGRAISAARRRGGAGATVSLRRALGRRPASPGGVAQGAEGDGVPQLGHRRNAVLPRGPRRAGQDVGRPRRQLQLVHPPLLADTALEPHEARRQQRHPDHGRAEHRRVAVPADGRAGRVAGDERLRQGLRPEAGQVGAAVAQPPELLGQGIGRRQPPRLVAVVEPEVTNRATGHLPMHPHLVQGHRLDRREQGPLLGLVEQVGLVDEPLRALDHPTHPRHAPGVPQPPSGRTPAPPSTRDTSPAPPPHDHSSHGCRPPLPARRAGAREA